IGGIGVEERHRRTAKRKLVQMSGTSSHMLPGHLDEVLWRDCFGDGIHASFNNLLTHLSEWYNVNNQ
ncbi:Uncharacterized protein FKW44_015126, partial [Caligus rogercresseyi]